MADFSSIMREINQFCHFFGRNYSQVCDSIRVKLHYIWRNANCSNLFSLFHNPSHLQLNKNQRTQNSIKIKGIDILIKEIDFPPFEMLISEELTHAPPISLFVENRLLFEEYYLRLLYRADGNYCKSKRSGSSGQR